MTKTPKRVMRKMGPTFEATHLGGGGGCTANGVVGAKQSSGMQSGQGHIDQVRGVLHAIMGSVPVRDGNGRTALMGVIPADAVPPAQGSILLGCRAREWGSAAGHMWDSSMAHAPG